MLYAGAVKKRPPPQHVAETEVLMGRVKAAKSAARHMREGGMQQKASAQAALSAVGAKHADKQKKKKAKPTPKPDLDDDGGVRAPSNSHVYAGACSPACCAGCGKWLGGNEAHVACRVTCTDACV